MEPFFGDKCTNDVVQSLLSLYASPITRQSSIKTKVISHTTGKKFIDSSNLKKCATTERSSNPLHLSYDLNHLSNLKFSNEQTPFHHVKSKVLFFVILCSVLTPSPTFSIYLVIKLFSYFRHLISE